MPTALVLFQLCLLTISLLQNDPASDFQDLGRWLLGGFVAAVVVAIALTFIKLRLRDRNPPEQFISIKSDKIESQ